jgi:4-hydroxy-3-methylbut-2-enyl diphosphate reductase
MKIIRASHLGMCFGVRDAIALAIHQSSSTDLTILGELVHNETVLSALRDIGVKTARNLGDVTTSTVMITAHGASEKTVNAVRARGHNVLSATCPLVSHAHESLAGLVADGFFPIIIGRREHVEVLGLTGDLAEFEVILSEQDVDGIQERPHFGIVAQTTQPIERVRALVEYFRNRFSKSEVRFIDTVCQPTKQRQTAAIRLARECDVVVVIGGAHSNNTHELVKTCGAYCPRVHHVQSAAEIQSHWFTASDLVGITAGTSTPESTIQDVEDRLRNAI